jgi:hypothetical protein
VSGGLHPGNPGAPGSHAVGDQGTLTSQAIAAGTDYGIFIIGRYQEARQAGEEFDDRRGDVLPQLRAAALFSNPGCSLRGGDAGRCCGRAPPRAPRSPTSAAHLPGFGLCQLRSRRPKFTVRLNPRHRSHAGLFYRPVATGFAAQRRPAAPFSGDLREISTTAC